MTSRLRCVIGIVAIAVYVGLALFVLMRRLVEPTPEILAAGIASLAMLILVAIYSCGWCACYGAKETPSDGFKTMEMATTLGKQGPLRRFH